MARIRKSPKSFGSAGGSEKTRIVICADDFGQSAAIDEGIATLVALGRVSAVSCLSQSEHFAADAGSIQNAGIDLGVHLNFTEGMGSRGWYVPLPRLIVMAYRRRLDQGAIEAQIHQQLQAFENVVGRVPDFIDGHQHVHQLPQIREALFAVCRQRWPEHRPWLRNTASRPLPAWPWRLRFKAAVIAALGAANLREMARRNGFPFNPGFLGVYDFVADRPAYPVLLEAWLTGAQPGDVLMCHPASAVSPGDVLGEQRVREFAALVSEDFGKWLHRFNLHVGRAA